MSQRVDCSCGAVITAGDEPALVREHGCGCAPSFRVTITPTHDATAVLDGVQATATEEETNAAGT